MNLLEARKVAFTAQEIENIVNTEYTLETNVGSIGEKWHSLKVIIKDANKNSLFEEEPDCIGYEHKSNYSYSETRVKKPTESIYSWVKRMFPTAKWFELQVSMGSDWEGQNRTSHTVKAEFWLTYACGRVETFQYKERLATRSYTQTKKVWASEDDCGCDIDIKCHDD